MANIRWKLNSRDPKVNEQSRMGNVSSENNPADLISKTINRRYIVRERSIMAEENSDPMAKIHRAIANRSSRNACSVIHFTQR